MGAVILRARSSPWQVKPRRSPPASALSGYYWHMPAPLRRARVVELSRIGLSVDVISTLTRESRRQIAAILEGAP